MSALDALTGTSSHELCEAITDPVPGTGWYDDRNGEIGDICAWAFKKLGGHVVQLEWSNAAGKSACSVRSPGPGPEALRSRAACAPAAPRLIVWRPPG